MNRIIFFLVVVYLISAVGAWALFSKNTGTNIAIGSELAAVKQELASAQKALETEKAQREIAEKKNSNARTNAAFLSLALCPVLDATNKNALCVKNGAEWLSQTMILGTAITDPNVKAKMDTLLVSLGSKTKPTAKQLYEMLKPTETESLRSLVETLK